MHRHTVIISQPSSRTNFQQHHKLHTCTTNTNRPQPKNIAVCYRNFANYLLLNRHINMNLYYIPQLVYTATFAIVMGTQKQQGAASDDRTYTSKQSNLYILAFPIVYIRQTIISHNSLYAFNFFEAIITIISCMVFNKQ